MIARRRRSVRRGAVLPLVAISTIGLMSMIALAIDLGMVTLARNQAQNAADLAALAGVRQLNGDSSDSQNINNYNAVEPTAKAAAAENSILNKQVAQSEVTVKVGVYTYNATLQRFEASFPGSLPSGESWGAVEVDVASNQPTYFARIFGVSTFQARTTARAVHRPRDIAIVLDFSGSMHFSSLSAWEANGEVGGSLNPDTRIPRFGHWSSSTVQDQMRWPHNYDYEDPNTGEIHARNNFTLDTEGGTALVNDFYTGTPDNLTPAFNRAAASYDALTAATPAPDNFDVQSDSPVTYVGDKWPRIGDNSNNGYATTVKEFLDGDNDTLDLLHAKNTEFEGDDPSNPTADDGYGPDFKGYSMGPGYVGKTFWMWPPDPRYHPTNPDLQLDWRKKFFYYTNTTTPMDDNRRLWKSNGEWNRSRQSDTYDINYTAVVQWIKSGPSVLPPNLRAGRVLYYSDIPNSIPQSGGTMDQRFWREYIDHVLAAGSETEQEDTLFGEPDYTWGTMRVNHKSDLNSDPDERPYMYYRDNPRRPRMHFWFGPVSMLDFLSETRWHYRNWLPGTAHEAQTWQLKAGIQSALTDIEKNHPNDNASLIYFAHLNEFATPRVQMGKNYARMKNALFYPFSLLDSLGTVSNEIRPYDNGFDDDVSNGELPNGHGGTAPEMGFKLAYNEFSSRSGYFGRKGAAKMVIFETDGVPNTLGDGGFSNGGPYNSYYANVQTGSSMGNNNTTVVNRALDVVERICALDTDTMPGYSTPKLQARVHALAFGDLFQSNSSRKAQALSFLLQVQKKGKTSQQSASSIESYKIITGNFNTRIDNLKNAMERIMQSGVQVSLVR